MTVYPARLEQHVDGRWYTPDSADGQMVRDPATDRVVGELAFSGTDDLDAALDAAAAGFRSWKSSAPDERSRALAGAARLLRERTEMIATLATTEQGKPLAEAKAEVAYAVRLVEWYAAEALRTYGRVLARTPDRRSFVVKEPVGPALALCPWNFPILNPVRKLAPALAAGCSVILKPSEETPASAAEVVRCFLDAGLAPNLISLVFGRPDLVSSHLLASPVIRKLSFTGSVPVGKHLMRLAADTMKRTTMELGGHAPVIVFDDVDLDSVVPSLVAAKFRNAGQVCISPTRFFVQEGIYHRFLQRFAEQAASLRLGSGLDPQTQMGPLANPRRPHTVDALVSDAMRTGATLYVGGERVDRPGNFFLPTVLADVPDEAALMNEEPFGPVAAIRPFRTLDDVIEDANRLPYGLAAYCFVRDLRTATLLGHALEAGMVCINNMTPSQGDAPFGGVKESGHGSEDGPEGLDAFLVTKAIHQC